MNFNLIDKISAEDKVKIENYIKLYGVPQDFIGLDNWLKPWSDNKIKMYKMLGNQLIYKVPFEFNKSENDLHYQIKELVNNDPFINDIMFKWFRNNKEAFPLDDYYQIQDFIWSCISSYNICEDEIDRGLKFKLENSKKTFQIQKKAKPIRALGKFLTYCKDIEGVGEVIEAFEQFRIKHSMILNDKVIKGNLAISIHPLDFMTMSDNDSNWSSCMSWVRDGCYHVGTIEMMNSNNVLCCYIENSEPYYFDEDNKSEEYKWNNKKWRQLVYFTKDIIVSGKPYPYENENISKFIIETVRDLAKKNLNWTYSFGPELYQDMKHINGAYSMNRAKKFIANKNTKKHNIIFDTKGMYNDMLNDNNTKYWCVRNKVKHTKVISYSGKCPCLCCGDTIIEENYDYSDDYTDYNERYSATGAVICYECRESKFRCNICNCTDSTEKHYTLKYNGTEIKVCEECWNNYIRECPDCKRPMLNPLYYSHYYGLSISNEVKDKVSYIRLSENVDLDELSIIASRIRSYTCNEENIKKICKTIMPICRCIECTRKNEDNFESKLLNLERFWYRERYNFLLSKDVKNENDYKEFFPYNLKEVEKKDNITII